MDKSKMIDETKKFLEDQLIKAERDLKILDDYEYFKDVPMIVVMACRSEKEKVKESIKYLERKLNL